MAICIVIIEKNSSEKNKQKTGESPLPANFIGLGFHWWTSNLCHTITSVLNVEFHKQSFDVYGF